MNDILITILVLYILVYGFKVFIGFKIMSNNDMNINEIIFPRGFITILHIGLINTKNLRINNKLIMLGFAYNMLTYVIYSLIIMNFFVILFQNNIIINN